MKFTVWTVLFAALVLYAGMTVVWYYFRLRPLLRSRRQQAQAEPASEEIAATSGARSLSAASTVHGGGSGAAPEDAANLLTRLLPQEEWRHTFDAILDPIVILDRNLTVVRGNRAAFQLLSSNGAPLEGKRCHQLFAGLDQPCSCCPVPSVLREKGPVKLEVVQRYLGRTFAVACSPITIENDIVGFVHSVKDISQQRYLEKRLLHTHKLEAISTMAGGIAHDFNNILGAILGNADLLLYRLPAASNKENPAAGPVITFDEIYEHVLAIKRAGNRARDLVTQILAFSRQSTNQRRNIFIAPVVREACRLLRASTPSTIDLRISIADEVGLIYADPSQIQQIVTHLATNAVQAIESGIGSIEVGLREVESGAAEQTRYHNLEPGRYVVLSVKDTGKGMPPDILERIFNPFYTTRDVGEGSGMGLAVLHGIITSHDGVIDVQSEQGKGTIFTIFFPRVVVAEESDDDLVTAMPKGSGTILFVDDEEDIVQMRTRMLTYLGYNVLPAIGPEQAMGYFRRNPDQIDLVITDHTMPRKTGVQLATEINAIRPDLPIFLCSGYSEAVTAEESERAGIRRFLAKPVDMRLLATAIREFLPGQDGGNV